MVIAPSPSGPWSSIARRSARLSSSRRSEMAFSKRASMPSNASSEARADDPDRALDRHRRADRPGLGGAARLQRVRSLASGRRQERDRARPGLRPAWLRAALGSSRRLGGARTSADALQSRADLLVLPARDAHPVV